MEKRSDTLSPSLSELPTDELAAYGCGLGLPVDGQTPRGELLRLIEQAACQADQEAHDALLGIVHLLDAVQDGAADQLGEEAVFGPEEEKDP